MIKYIRNLDRSVNPVKLADEAVFALSSIERGKKASPELLKKGVELCDYLMSLLREPERREAPRTKLSFRAVHDNKKALQERGVDIGRVRRTKKRINDLIKDPSSHKPEAIRSMQEFLMTTTMPMWQNRSLESRERKLKRGLIIRG